MTLKMSKEIDDIVKFVENFKNTILLPLAQAGVLNADLLVQAKEIYSEELKITSQPITSVRIEKDGKWNFLIPQESGPIKVDEKEYGSVEHYRVASAYIGYDEDFAEYIRESKTPQLAHRRGDAADAARKPKRLDFEKVRESELKKAYAALLIANPAKLKELKATGDVPILYLSTSDPYHGTGVDGHGQNVIGKILMSLRNEL